MKVAIMQPYFLPYIGYFQLINAVDKFVVYDNIEYTKKGWINRNRILANGKEEFISLPISKASDFLDVNQRYLASNFENEKNKILRKIQEYYRKAPYFKITHTLTEEIFNHENNNLFEFIFNSIKKICQYLGISTDLITSSSIDINHNLKSEDKVISICNSLNARTYINSIGGKNLYEKKDFHNNNIELIFIQSKPIAYEQFDFEFLPWLSILDVLMFNSTETVKDFLKKYEFL
jgi:hypothetical protein